MSSRPPIVALLCLALLLGGCTGGAGIEDTPDNRRLAALRYQAAMPMEELMGSMADRFNQAIPPEARESARAAMLQGIDFQRLKAASLELMVKHFTAGEIEALTDFYLSPEGRAVMAKMPAYSAELMPVIQAEVMRNFGE